MTAPAADWGDWLARWRTGECRPCETCAIGLHDICAWRPGGAHERGWDTHIAYLIVGTGPASRSVIYGRMEASSVRMFEKRGRRWRCTCECRHGGYRTPRDIPGKELALW